MGCGVVWNCVQSGVYGVGYACSATATKNNQRHYDRAVGGLYSLWGLAGVCVCGGVVCKRMKTVKKKVEEREKKKKNGNGTTKKQSKERKTENLNPYISEWMLCGGF